MLSSVLYVLILCERVDCRAPRRGGVVCVDLRMRIKTRAGRCTFVTHTPFFTTLPPAPASCPVFSACTTPATESHDYRKEKR